MAKYNFEFKMNVVQEYLHGVGSFRFLSKKYGVSKTCIHVWVAEQERSGAKCLLKSRKRKEYSFEFKMQVVKLYLESEFSYRELAFEYGISNPALIARWVRGYRAAGPDALKPKYGGRRLNMDEDKIIKEIESSDDEDQKKFLKKLQDENLRLRIENAFLKESRRLRLEEEALQKEQRESSTVSEKNSN